MVECITKGKNTGSLFGMPATNRELALPMIHIYDFEEGKVVRQRTYANYQMMMQQLMGEQLIMSPDKPHSWKEKMDILAEECARVVK